MPRTLYGLLVGIDHYRRPVPPLGVCVNDVVVQLSAPDLPFGGVGMAGFGRYHGRAGFEAFSNLKSVLRRHLWPEPPLRTVPHSEGKLRWIERLM